MRGLLARHKRPGLLVLVLICFLVLGISTSPSLSTPQQKRILRYNSVDDAQSIDPGVGSDFPSSTAFPNLYDTLVFPSNDGSVRPHLATNWTVSTDGLTYTFNLRKGVKFHNGDELTAGDVVFSMKRMLAIGEGYGYLFTNTVASARASGRYTVQFKLSKRFGPFVASLVRLYVLSQKQVTANIQKPGSYGAMGDYGKKWLLTHDAGSGPYIVKEFKKRQHLLMVKFPAYWQGFDKDNPDVLELFPISETPTERTLLLRQDLEVTDELQPTEFYEAVKKTAGIEVVSMTLGATLYLMLNNRKPPTDDVHFRRALTHIVDYGVLTNTIFPGSKRPLAPVAGVLAGAVRDTNAYSYDLNKAREDLKKSKYFGKLDEFPVEIQWIAEVPDREKVALMIQAEAAKVGIRVKIVKQPWASFVENAAKQETTPNASLVAVYPNYAEAGSLLASRFHSRSTGTWEQIEWLKDPKVDALIDEAIGTVDRSKRLAKYREVQEILIDNAVTVPLIDVGSRFAYWSSYVRWEAAERAKAGLPVNLVLGYIFYGKDFKIFPEKRK